MKKDSMIWNVRQLLENEEFLHVYPDIPKDMYFEVEDFFTPETFYETAFLIYFHNNRFGIYEYFVMSSRGIYWKYNNKSDFLNYSQLKNPVWFDFDKNILRLDLSGNGIVFSRIKRKNAENLCRLINIFTEEYRNKDRNRKFLVSVKGKIYGPWTAEHIRGLIDRGKFTSTDIRLNPEDEEQKWYNLSEMEEFSGSNKLDKVEIRKQDIMKCDPEIVLFSDGMDLDKMEKLMIARENGLRFSGIEKLGEYLGLLPHHIVLLSEKFFIETGIDDNCEIVNRRSIPIDSGSGRVVDF